MKHHLFISKKSPFISSILSSQFNMNNNRKSPFKQQQRMKNSYAIPVPNSNRIRSNSSMGSTYSKKANSHTTSPTALSASSLPAVPLFYSNVYADPPDCSALPQPPESWYLTTIDETISPLAEEIKEKPSLLIEEAKEKSQQKSSRKSNYKKQNRGFNHSFYPTQHYNQFPAPYISVKA
ncbi:hypothetical protein I4U23_025810 [Adineta vaga]|nr:hypothetical protein I4U23_025810 [Adineta vaga]